MRWNNMKAIILALAIVVMLAILSPAVTANPPIQQPIIKTNAIANQEGKEFGSGNVITCFILTNQQHRFPIQT
jgi:hypothetical protein